LYQDKRTNEQNEDQKTCFYYSGPTVRLDAKPADINTHFAYQQDFKGVKPGDFFLHPKHQIAKNILYLICISNCVSGKNYYCVGCIECFARDYFLLPFRLLK